MRSKTKKLIALLSVCCMATAVVGIVGCNKKKDEATETEKIYQLYVAAAEEAGEEAMTYEQWLAAIKGADGKDGKDGADGKDAHEHTYDADAEPVVLIAPTGAGAGLGYITCNAEDCGHIEMKTLDKVAGIIPTNPIELVVGEEETVAINTYDENQLGANVLMGEYGVAYFKFDVEGVNLLSIAESETNVRYTFYRDETFKTESDRYVGLAYDDDWNVIPNTVYLKAEYSNFEENSTATIKVNARSVETTEVKYNLQLENYDENTTGTVTAFNENGEKEPINFEGFGDDGKGYVMLDALKKWKLQVEVDDGHYVYSGGTVNVDFPLDGSLDDGKGESVITVAKQYIYKFNVADQAGAKVLYDAVVTVADENFNTLASAKTNHLGVATICLQETKDNEDNFVTPVGYASVSGFGVTQSAALELTPKADTQAVTEGFTLVEGSNFEFNVEVDHSVGAWTVDGEANEVNPYAAIAGGVVTLTDAGEYTLAVNGKTLQGEFIVSVDGKDVESFAAMDKVIISLGVGESKVGVRSVLNPSVGVAGVTLAPAPAPTVLELDENNTASLAMGVEYVYNVSAAGDYKVSVVDTGTTTNSWWGPMFSVYESRADYKVGNSWGEYVANDNPMQTTVNKLEGETISFYLAMDGGEDPIDSVIVTIEYVPAPSAPVPTEVELDTEIALVQGGFYSFTAKKTTTYYFTCSKPLAKPEPYTYKQWVGLGVTASWNTYAEDNLYNSVQEKYAAINVVAGETYTFYASKVVGEGKLYIVTERPDDYVAPEVPDEGGDDEMGGMGPRA